MSDFAVSLSIWFFDFAVRFFVPIFAKHTKKNQPWSAETSENPEEYQGGYSTLDIQKLP